MIRAMPVTYGVRPDGFFFRAVEHWQILALFAEHPLPRTPTVTKCSSHQNVLHVPRQVWRLLHQTI